MPTAPRDEVVATIVKALTPYVGATMAAASARGMCEKLGFGAGPLEAPQIEKLIEALAPGLNVFVGRDKAAQVLGDLRKALHLGGGA